MVAASRNAEHRGGEAQRFTIDSSHFDLATPDMGRQKVDQVSARRLPYRQAE